MLKTLSTSRQDSAWLGAFATDFLRRWHTLLAFEFRKFGCVQALSVEEAASNGSKLDPASSAKRLTKTELEREFSPYDLKRLDAYANNMADYHVINDLVPPLARLYFAGRFGQEFRLSGVQSAILLAIGLQYKYIEDIEKELSLAVSQLLAMFNKIIRKFSTYFRDLVEGAVIESMPENMTNGDADAHHVDGNANAAEADGIVSSKSKFQPLDKPLSEELREGKEEVDKELKEKQRALIDALPLGKYEIADSEPSWVEAEDQVQRTLSKNGSKGIANGDAPTVSVKSQKKAEKRKGDTTAEELWKQEDAKHEAAVRGKKAKKAKAR